MKQQEYTTQDMPPRPRRRFGWALTALVLVATLALNVAAGLLFDRNRWFVDNTVTELLTLPHTMYTLTDEARGVVEKYGEPAMREINQKREAEGKPAIKTEIIFCADRDKLEGNTLMRYILYTALALQKEFDWIEVSYLNVEKNPTLAQAYKATTATHIYPSDVIVACGSEYRVQKSTGFFAYDDAAQTKPWSYNGEKAFAASILAVTCAEAPIACLTTNHGEPVGNCQALMDVIKGAGYKVQLIDLEKDEIPEDCRLIVTYDPQRDFYGYGNYGATGASEIDKLDAFLDGAYSFLLFVDHETPVLPNLEEYMQEWGVTVRRGTDADGDKQNYHIKDAVEHMDSEGYTPVGAYATAGLGATVTADMRKVSYPARVLFPNATALGMSDSYTLTYQEPDDTTGKQAYQYGHYYRNGVIRNLFDVFTAGQSAVAEIDGKSYEVTTKENVFKLMTMASETRTVQESNYSAINDASYVCVCASTEFASDEVLTSAAYGNADVLSSALRSMGGEILPVDVDLFKWMDEPVVSNESFLPAHPVALTVCLTVIPSALIAALGVVVTVRRKHR